jgi:hypothetical protein
MVGASTTLYEEFGVSYDGSTRNLKYMGERNGKKYYSTTYWTQWSNADAFARSLGGYLVVFDEDGEEAWVKDALGSSKANQSQRFWLGYNYRLGQSAWKWANSSTYSTTNWNSGFPSNQASNQFAYSDRDWSYWQNYGSSDYAYQVIEFDNNLSNATGSAITVALATGTETDAATASGTDYTLAASSLSIAANASSASTTVTVVADETDEKTETVTLTASSSVAGAVVKSSQKNSSYYYKRRR